MCISDDLAAAFVEGGLAASVRTSVEQHLDTCGECRQLVSHLVRVQQRASVGVQTAQPSAELALEPGATVGRYVIERGLGQGGMGTVYAAYDPDLARTVAVKLLHAPDAERERMLHEARTMARITHPNVITVYDVGSEHGRMFLAMELIDGTTLREWLRSAPRSWRDIVATFVAAGRGLVAAHRTKVVHRDFKPDNVLCSRDGRVCVTDFGVAAATPAYMAPEQAAGKTPSAESDQYSFCVSLSEALRDSQRVPRSIERALERGLAAAPRDRYPDMASLLSALDASPRRRRRWLAATGAGVVLVAVVAAWQLHGRPAICESAEARLAGVWDPARKQVIRSAFERTHVAYAADAWTRVATVLDVYTRRWVAMHGEACRATRVRGEQSDEVLTLRMLCLNRALAQLAALADALATADRDAVAHAVQATAGLPRVEACSDVAALVRAPKPAADPTKRAQAEAIRNRLAAARTLKDLGRIQAALSVLAPLHDSAIALGDRELAASAAVALGDVRSESGDYKGAEQALYLAVSDAEYAGADGPKADAWSQLAWVTGYLQADRAQGKRFADLASAVIERTGNDPERRAQLLSRQAGIIASADPQRALDDLARARTLVEKLRGPTHVDVGLLHSSEAASLLLLGKYDEALAHEQRAIAILEAALGRIHPQLVGPLSNLGWSYMLLDRIDDAAAAYRRALEVAEASLPADSPVLADAVHGSALPLLAKGAGAAAQKQFERALAIREKSLGPNHPHVALSLLGIAQALELQQRDKPALDAARRALAIYEKIDDGKTTDVADTLVTIARLALAADDIETARASAVRANALQDELIAADHPDHIDALTLLAAIDRRTGQPARAVTRLERALAIAKASELAPIDQAEPRFELAQALWQLDRDRARALALATAARDAWTAQPGREPRSLAHVKAWLANHAGTPR